MFVRLLIRLERIKAAKRERKADAAQVRGTRQGKTLRGNKREDFLSNQVSSNPHSHQSVPELRALRLHYNAGHYNELILFPEKWPKIVSAVSISSSKRFYSPARLLLPARLHILSLFYAP